MTVGVVALWQDVRLAVRAYRRAPGFALIVVLTLGVATGANTAIFSLLNALALRDLPVRDPGALVQISTTSTQGASNLTFQMLRELSDRQSVFTSVLAASTNRGVLVSDRGNVKDGLLWGVTGNLFDDLGIRPAAGRLIAPSDMTLDPPSAHAVTVLGYDFWHRHYQGDTSIVGQVIEVEGKPFTVVGVAPAGFTGFELVTAPDITIPLTAMPLLSGNSPSTLSTATSRSVRMFGRLRDGLTLEQAGAQLSSVWPTAREAALPATYTGALRNDFLSVALQVSSASKGDEAWLRREYRLPLSILLGMSGFVLLIACTNVASLLLARASARRQQIGVCLALGASRWRVARQLVVEAVLLSLAGAACGVLLAFWACREITRIVFEDMSVPVMFDGTPDMRVLAIATVVAVLVGAMCSALPAWRITRGNATTALQTAGRTFSASGRSGRALVGIQLALSLAMLTMAGVLVRSLWELRALETGIERSGQVVVAYTAPAYPRAYDGIDNDSYYPQLLQRIEAMPLVKRASASLLKPGAGGGGREMIARFGETADAAGMIATRSPVSPGFFDVVGISLIKGRDFEWRDSSRSNRVTVLSESLARRLFGDAEPIGRRVRIGLDPSRADVEVIGVAADARLYNLKSADVFAAYTPALQDQSASYKCLVIRAEDLSLAALKASVESLGRERLYDMVTLKYITDRSLLRERLTALLASFYGSLVLLLAGLGLFALMSYAVAQRRREVGIRMALGADRSRVVLDVVYDGLKVTGFGLAAGLVVSFATVRVVKALLFGVTPQDPLTLAGAAASLVAIAVLACVVPASKAANVDPVITLRGE